MNKIKCRLCGTPKTVSQNESFHYSYCTAEITINNDGEILKEQIRPSRLLAKLKSLTDREKEADAERLLNTLLINTISDSYNYAKVIKARDMFAEWLSKRR